MKYISSDTNVWLDFNSIDRIEIPFRLSCTYIVYKEALRSEIVSPPDLIPELIKRGLEGVDLTTEEFYYALEGLGKYVKLSNYDKTALAIAKFREIPLLTGDNALRKAARKEGVQVFGTIGLLDRLYYEKFITQEEYDFCLKAFLNHPERRLPQEEIIKRIGGE